MLITKSPYIYIMVRLRSFIDWLPVLQRW